MVDRMLIKDMPECERPREKLLTSGVDTLSNVELLAILIQNGTGKLSAIDLSHQVLGNYQEGIASLGNSTQYELMNIKGIGSAKACRILAGLELGKRVNASRREILLKVCEPSDVAHKFMPMLRHLMHEECHICLLNAKNEIFMHRRISMGSLNSSILHPREIFAMAIKHSASAIVLLHNHPSGHVEPSEEDICITKRIIDAGDILGIRVLDHIIIGDGQWCSMKADGYME